MLAQAETKHTLPFGNRNGQPDKSDGSDPQFAKLKTELTLAQRANLKNQLHQAKRTSQRNGVQASFFHLFQLFFSSFF